MNQRQNRCLTRVKGKYGNGFSNWDATEHDGVPLRFVDLFTNNRSAFYPSQIGDTEKENYLVRNLSLKRA